MKKTLIKSLLLTTIITASMSISAFAAVDGYILKDSSDIVYQYNLEELKDSLKSNILGNKDTLFLEFNEKLGSSKIHLIHDSEGKYVSFNEMKTILINKTLNKDNFNLNDEVKKANASEIPPIIETIKKEKDGVAKELVILKDGITLDGSKISKDKYKAINIKANNITLSNLDILGELIVDPGNLGKVRIDNVKCSNINILSGDKKGIIFNKVESKEVKIDDKLEIEIQYEDKNSNGNNAGAPSNGGNAGTPSNGGNAGVDEATKKSMLTKASNQLNKILGLVKTENERQVINKILSGITSAANDPTYNYSADIAETKALYYSLTEAEKTDLKDKIMKNVDVFNMYELMSIYGLEL